MLKLLYQVFLSIHLHGAAVCVLEGVKFKKNPSGSISKHNTSVSVRFSVLALNSTPAHVEFHAAFLLFYQPQLMFP